MNKISAMSIGQVAERTGLAASTLRYYEQLGLMAPLERRGGQRRYDLAAIRRVNYIQVAQRAGFSLLEIKTLIYGFPEETAPGSRWQQLASTKLPEIEALIEQAQQMKHAIELGIRCGCKSLEECEIKLSSHNQSGLAG